MKDILFMLLYITGCLMLLTVIAMIITYWVNTIKELSDKTTYLTSDMVEKIKRPTVPWRVDSEAFNAKVV